MRTISIAEVDEVWSRITQASEKECRRLPQRMQKLVASYHQMPLLGAVLEALMTGNEDEPAARSGGHGPGFAPPENRDRLPGPVTRNFPNTNTKTMDNLLSHPQQKVVLIGAVRRFKATRISPWLSRRDA